MKSIEERAGNFAHTYELLDDAGHQKCAMQIARECFAAGAQSERAELTRWHDPQEELPEDRTHVLAKTTRGNFEVVFYDHRMEIWYSVSSTYRTVLGWREIHENE